MEELLQELADAELGKQVMVTVGVTGTKKSHNTFIRKLKDTHSAFWREKQSFQKSQQGTYHAINVCCFANKNTLASNQVHNCMAVFTTTVHPVL